MAAKSECSSQSRTSFSELLACPRCRIAFDNETHIPYSLASCGHCLCCECFQALTDHSAIFCPKCRAQTPAPVSVNAELLQILTETSSPQCGICEEFPSVSGCLECKTQFCSSCWSQVHRGKLAVHQAIDPEAFQDRLAERCSMHPFEIMSISCANEECKGSGQPMCSLCVLSGPHQEHKTEPIDQAARAKRSELQATLRTTEERIRAGVKILGEINESDSNQAGEDRDQAKSLVRERIDLLIQRLKQKRAELCQEIDEAAAIKGAKLQEQLEQLTLHLLHSYKAIHTAAEALEGRDLPFLSSFTSLHSQLIDLAAQSLPDRSLVTDNVSIIFRGGVEAALEALDTGSVQQLKFNQEVWDAAQYGQVEKLVQALQLHGSSIDVPDTNGKTPMIAAAENGHAIVIDELARHGSKAIDVPDKDGNTPMHFAAFRGHVDAIEALVRHGSLAINSPNEIGEVPLLSAVDNTGVGALTRVKVVEALARLGADLDLGDDWTCAPMYSAAWNGFAPVIEALVRLGSKAIDTPTNDGWTPMHAAASSGHVSVIETLVRLGSNAIDTPTNDGWAPMYAAAYSGHASAIEALVRLGSKAIDTPDNDGWTPMHTAIYHGNIPVIRTLVRLGSKTIDTPSNDGWTPMQLADAKGYGPEIFKVESPRSGDSDSSISSDSDSESESSDSDSDSNSGSDSDSDSSDERNSD